MRHEAFLIIAAFLCLACHNTMQPLDGSFAAVVIYGNVVGPDGASVADVDVTAEARVNVSCRNANVRAQMTALTDGSGRYRIFLGTWGDAATTCLNVRISPPAGSGFA